MRSKLEIFAEPLFIGADCLVKELLRNRLDIWFLIRDLYCEFVVDSLLAKPANILKLTQMLKKIKSFGF